MGVPGTVVLLARCLNFRASLYGLADITTHHYKNPCEKKTCLQLSRFMDAQICSGAQPKKRNSREAAIYCHYYHHEAGITNMKIHDMAISSLFRRRDLHVGTPGRWTYILALVSSWKSLIFLLDWSATCAFFMFLSFLLRPF